MLFDLDGCLVDSTEAITTCLNETLVSLGLPARSPDSLRWMIGPPLADGMEQLLADSGAPANWRDEAIARYRARYRDVSLTHTRVVAGVPEMLDALAATVAMAVVTSKPRVFAAPILMALGLGDRFVAIHGPDVDGAAEAKPVTLGRALAELDAFTATAMVGDRRHDVEAGRAHRLVTVGVTWGAGDRDELESAGADVIVDEPTALEVALAAISRVRSADR